MSLYIPDIDEVWEIMKGSISKRSERDKQVNVGPSELGGCAYCVGYTMASKFYELPERNRGFGYAAWLGTMCHFWLEHNLELPVESLREHKVKVFDIEGYGTVRGSTDLLVPEWERTFDFKFPGKYSYDKVALALRTGGFPSNAYRYQQQCYAHGANKAGITVKNSVILFFPRHTNSIEDVIPYEEPYRPEMVDLLQRRTEAIWEDVQDGNLDLIPSDDDCFECDDYRGSGRKNIGNYLERPIEQGATK
jgi:hypothetical protein